MSIGKSNNNIASNDTAQSNYVHDGMYYGTDYSGGGENGNNKSYVFKIAARVDNTGSV